MVIRHSLARVRQTGAALVTGLLLLLVLTILAVSGMNSASLELMMAGNEQYRQNAFQAAETGIAQSLVVGSFDPATISEPAATDAAVTGSSTDSYTATIDRQANGLPMPAVYGFSWDSFSTYHFEITSTGASTRNATARNVQGVAIISPYESTVTPLNPTSPALN